MVEQNDTKSSAVVVFILACVCLPLLESCSGGTLWGLKWRSPVFMEQLSEIVRIVKLILVCASVCLLIIKRNTIRATMENIKTRRPFIAIVWGLALIQFPFLWLGILVEGIMSSDPEYLHKEKQYSDRSIYVYTFDPGAMGKAYQYFYLKCPRSLNRYDLTHIKTTNRMYEYSFDVVENELIIDDKSLGGTITKTDISDFTCD